MKTGPFEPVHGQIQTGDILEKYVFGELQLQQTVRDVVFLLYPDAGIHEIRRIKLHARHVDGQRENPFLRIQPLPQQAAGRCQHISVKPDDETVPLEQGNELTG